MGDSKPLRRRSFLKAGAVTMTAAAAPAAAQPAPSAAGQTKIVCVVGDADHNPLSQEIYIRRVLGSNQNWRVLFVRASRFFTPELIRDADLLITARHAGSDAIGWSTHPVVDTMVQGDPFWTSAQVAAIVENVTRRGMGFLALHNTLACGSDRIAELLDVVPLQHYEIQPLWAYDLNQEHPITRGIQSFYINVDDQYHGIIKTADPIILFRTSAVHDKREAVGGWCLERGKGRIVALLPGHTEWTYRAPGYQDILWRSAHWAMRRDIPAYPGGRNVT
jgi:type 1 glutamine amidotransferase